MTAETPATTSGGPTTPAERSGRRARPAGARPPATPFVRVARTHGAAIAGDTLVAIALADSLFFSIDPNDARWRVALYLLVTMAPFAFVAPFLGPMMDRLRGGHRFMMIGASAIRVPTSIAMLLYTDSLLLFPLAFTMLVLGKTHHISKAAIVPAIVTDENELVEANSRLALLAAVSGVLAAVPGALALRFTGSAGALVLAAIVFATAVYLGTKIPASTVAKAPTPASEKAELRGAGILLAASAMGYVRGVVGFLTMLLAFELRGGIDPGPTGPAVPVGHRVREALGLESIDLSSGGAPTWHFGVALGAIGLGGLVGSIIAPRIRAHVREERMLAGTLAAIGIVALLGAFAGGLVAIFVVSLTVAAGAQTGKQAFDSIVQRDAPAANLGRSFSRFETRFQLVWVLGALIPVLLPLAAWIGFVILGGASLFAAISYWLGKDPTPTVDREKAKNLGTSVAARRRARKAAKSERANDPVEVGSGDDGRR